MTPAEAARADLARRMVQVEKMAALGRMAAGIVHEVNNPLSAIMGLTEVLLRRPDTPPDHMATLLKIHAEVDRIQKIMTGMLGFSRGAAPALGPVELRQVAEETLALAAPELKRRRVQAAIEAAPGLPSALGDAHALKQVLFNLVLNAAQAIDGRGGKIWLRLEEAGGRLQVEMADDGPGVPPEVADRIFEPFFTTKPEGQGTGLGLFTSAEIVRLHGGRLWVEPRPGGGAVFGFDLPRA
ncbi:MAG: ATP-binding protein [Elusimicrobia bacterium]|nr:ATP-binding protein [Elusimicrobiota bacterium]